MKGYKLSKLIQSIGSIRKAQNTDPVIKGIAYDSRKVGLDYIFFAICGLHTDGHFYIDQAVKNGATAIVFQNNLKRYNNNLHYIHVKDSRMALSKIADRFYNSPSSKLNVIGVTGTDGKSTTVWFIHQLLEMLGKSSGFISTVQLKYDKEVIKNKLRLSTPEAPTIHDILNKMVMNKKQFAVIETTSHGLSEKTKRLADVDFDVAVLTNITHEHLEFHGTYEQYRSDKANLFRLLDRYIKNNFKKNKIGIVNLDDPAAKYLKKVTKRPVYTYSLTHKEADLFASDICLDPKGSFFCFTNKGKTIRSRINIPGLFNIKNLMAAALTITEYLQINITRLSSLFTRLKGLEGRMDVIDFGQPFKVIVDYAHTPSSFESVMSIIRPVTRGRLISVFGSAGERDVEKRPMQGMIASKYCDIVIITDEDPRLEDRYKIIEQIASGCINLKKNENLFIEPNREKAISLALSVAKKDDTILLLGKGHEPSIIYPEGPHEWNESEVAKKLLIQAGYKP